MLTPIDRKRRLPQTVNLESFAGLLAKLDREVRRLLQAGTIEDLIDHSFNCAVTANHLLDWAWAEVVRRRRLGFGVASALDSKDDFRHTILDQFPDWVVIETIANASKHAGRPRTGVDVVAFPMGMKLGAKVPPDWDGNEALVDWSEAKWEWGADLIVGGSRQLHTGKLFPSVLHFWKRLAEELGLNIVPGQTEKSRDE